MREIKLIDEDDPILKSVADPVDNMYLSTPEGRLLITRLTDDMHSFLEGKSDIAKGVGLAAPQIGVSLRIFVMNYGGLKGTYINPRIISCDTKKGRDAGHEGCLSFPNMGSTIVERWKRIKVSYITPTGEHKSHYMQRLRSRIFQHELDHLNGITIKDHDEERRHALNYHI